MAVKRIYLAIILTAIIAVGIAVPTAYYLKPTASPLTTVTYRESWVFDGSNTADVVALENGYWKENGLNVILEPGLGSQDNAKRINLATDTFCAIDTDVLIDSDASGMNDVLVAMKYQTNPECIITRASSGLTTLASLQGHTLDTTPGEDLILELPAMCKANGVDFNKIKLNYISSSLKDKSFAEGIGDAEDTYVDYAPITMEVAYGIAVNIIWYKDYGFNLYGEGIATNANLIKTDPDLISRFVMGWAEGLEYTLQNPVAAAQLMVKYHPELPYNTALKQVETMNSLYVSPDVVANGLGHMDPTLMANSVNITATAFSFSSSAVNTNSIYTDQFIPYLYPPSTVSPTSAVSGSAPTSVANMMLLAPISPLAKKLQ